MTLKDLALDKLTQDLLFQNGVADRKNGVSMLDGWRQIRTEMGFSEYHTPAQERYEDGYYYPVSES